MTMGKQKTARPINNPNSTASTKAELTFSDHIGELRRRIFVVALVFVVASSLAYNYREVLLQIIMSPLHGQKLIYLTPAGGFSFIFQIAMYAGLLATAPVLIHQLYGFIKPALPLQARRSAIKVVLSALVLLSLGVAYGYFVAVPSALGFLSTFAGDNVLPSLTADSYLTFFLSYIAGLGLLFQLPLLLVFWHWISPLGPGGLLKSERWVILFAFVAAALITPTPDVVNQTMIAVPLIVMYQFGVIAVLMALFRERRARAKRAKLARQQAKVGAVARPFVNPVPVAQPLASPTMPTPVLTPAVKPLQPTYARRQVRSTTDGFLSRPIRPVQSRATRYRPPQTLDGFLRNDYA